MEELRWHTPKHFVLAKDLTNLEKLKSQKHPTTQLLHFVLIINHFVVEHHGPRVNQQHWPHRRCL